MVEFQSVSKSFDKKQILNDFSYRFDQKGLYAITGESGKGKTTFLRLIAHLEKTDKGHVISPQKISYSFQEYRLFSNLSLFDNIRLISFPKATEEDLIKIDYYLKKLNLDNDKSKYPEELSGGMKQRVSLIRALVADADVVLLDEPTKELDESLVAIVVEIIQELSKNKLIIVSVHSNEFAQSMNAKIISL